MNRKQTILSAAIILTLTVGFWLGAPPPREAHAQAIKTVAWEVLTNAVAQATALTARFTSGVLGASYGGAGTNNGVLKANGSGVVTRALPGTDFQAYDADLDTWSTVTPSANGKSLVAAADYAAMLALLNVEIGTDVEAWDADLDTYAGITPSATAQLALQYGNNSVVLCHRHRVTVAEINAGHEVLPAISGKSYRLVDCTAIAYGGAVGTTTTVDVLGTQAAGGVKLVAFEQANLTQSAAVKMGETGGTITADGASYTACDASTAITIGKTGGDADTATGVDFIITYVIE